MKLKQLEGYLQEVAVFDNPKIQFEQYPTTPHLAARMLYTAQNSYEDIEDKAVGDFGCGCGILRYILISMHSTKYNVGFDIDPDALAITQENCEELEIEMDLINIDLASQDEDLLKRFRGKLDTILMNPPFGTKNNAGIDMVFLKRGIELANKAVYSLHKTSTREHIMKKAKEWGVTCQVVAELKFDVPAMYKFHKKKSVDIEVDFLRFEKPDSN
ncbi:S-adenosyl-L-methionine-dependent methyltransferase [Basidiobolus meristosporus CBS 931.73]|uniref:Methyltransferase-like protein 5 n=1 Tax=Basidiobolus meristosporus CBS 931.73 TaxID=1314790 RepID=A0A1Y1Y649_9FUNG|nr:S-adenosyl-L-methionine-dependent methyltransferase [Basidiobolus meristosporus CBS 931.73]|eukprot:ORX93497.1 S-adenosyl-L-methionine-dependent methyltransferase [Basidiobolus meristosporus CBS 931.73]